MCPVKFSHRCTDLRQRCCPRRRGLLLREFTSSQNKLITTLSMSLGQRCRSVCNAANLGLQGGPYASTGLGRNLRIDLERRFSSPRRTLAIWAFCCSVCIWSRKKHAPRLRRYHSPELTAALWAALWHEYELMFASLWVGNHADQLGRPEERQDPVAPPQVLGLSNRGPLVGRGIDLRLCKRRVVTRAHLSGRGLGHGRFCCFLGLRTPSRQCLAEGGLTHLPARLCEQANCFAIIAIGCVISDVRQNVLPLHPNTILSPIRMSSAATSIPSCRR